LPTDNQETPELPALQASLPPFSGDQLLEPGQDAAEPDSRPGEATSPPAPNEQHSHDKDRERLADDLQVERIYAPSREALKAALRVVLGRPRVLEGDGNDGNDEEEGRRGVPAR
jgi:hypothetical protein